MQCLVKLTVGGQQFKHQKRTRQQASGSNEPDDFESEHAKPKRSKFRAITQEGSGPVVYGIGPAFSELCGSVQKEISLEIQPFFPRPLTKAFVRIPWLCPDDTGTLRARVLLSGFRLGGYYLTDESMDRFTALERICRTALGSGFR